MSINLSHRQSGSGYITTITYSREEKLNSLNSTGVKELHQAFISLMNDEDLRAIVLTGSGSKAFFGGADIFEMSEMDSKGAKEFITSLHKLFLAIRSHPVPVIARINGYTLGAGMELAAACDLRVSVDTAIFGMPEVRVGLPSVIEAALLPRLIGWGRSNYLVLTAENISATKAYEWGFLENICSENNLDKEINTISDAIACSGAIAVRSQKALVGKWEKLSLEDSINAGIDAFEKAYKTDEPNIMMQPFLNRKKRK